MRSAAEIWHDSPLPTRKRQLRLEDSRAFLGFRPEPTVRGIFGDPKVRIITLMKRIVESWRSAYPIRWIAPFRC